jgi:exopolysaccharide biosynthesis polyprenyl glycosylphosphotransferase
MLPLTRIRSIWLQAVLPVLDLFSLCFGALIVYIVRYKWLQDIISWSGKRVFFTDYFVICFGLSLWTVLLFVLLGVYEFNRKKSIIGDIGRIMLGITITLLCAITFFFFNEYNQQTLPNGVPVSRFVLATGGFFALFFVLVGRLIHWLTRYTLLYMGIGYTKVVVIGNEKEIWETEQILFRKRSSYIVQTFDSISEQNLEHIHNMIQKGQVNELFVYGTGQFFEVELAKYAERYKVNFILCPRLLNKYSYFSVEPLHLNGKLFLQLNHSQMDGWRFVSKRMFDIVFSLAFLALFWWVYLFIIIIIKLESSGPVVYKSQRVGPNGKVFELYKFRRMYQEMCTNEENEQSLLLETQLIEKTSLKKDKQSPIYKIAKDPRNTPFGSFLEQYSLDELPQFFNVLKGNMSVVGPRPHQPREVAKYSKDNHFKVFNMKPGITGMSQVNGRSDLSFEEEVDWDTYYLRTWNFMLDLWIILKTPYILLFKRHRN